MEVKVLKPIGYCFGVVNAISLALKVKNEFKDKNVKVLGYLVHNEEVVEYLNSKGIISIDTTNKNKEELINSFVKDDIIIFTAHGHEEYLENLLNERGIKYFDATCERVKKNIEVIKTNSTRSIIYIGKKFHPETESALSYSKNVYLYDIKEGIDYSKIKQNNPIVINQTTLSFLEIENIHKDILKNLPNAIIEDEICDATRVRQQQIKEIEKIYDLIVVVGSNKSSNTEQLYKIAKTHHKDSLVLKVNNYKELEKEDLSKCKRSLITSGTSTPLETIENIKEYLRGI